MPRRCDVPDGLREEPFLGSAAVRDGLLTVGRLRSSCWRRVMRDVYVHRDVALDIAMRARAAALVVPDGSAVSGKSAAWLYGADVLRPGDGLEVTLPRDAVMKPRAGLVIRRALLPGSDIRTTHGIAVTTPLRTAFDLARRRRPHHRRQLIEAVVAVDALAHLRLFNFETLIDYARLPEHAGWRGVRMVGEIVRLSDPAAESPMESRVRLFLVLAGLPRPVAQYEVRDRDGHLCARLDLAYPEIRLGIEYDGAFHRDQWPADIARQNALLAQGWHLLRFTAQHIRTPAAVVAQVRRELLLRRAA